MSERKDLFTLRRKHLPARFTAWWMRRVAGRYCPCQWPVKVRGLIRLCGWIDDEEARHEFIRFARWTIPATTATSSGSNVSVKWSQPTRRRHSEGQA